MTSAHRWVADRYRQARPVPSRLRPGDMVAGAPRTIKPGQVLRVPWQGRMKCVAVHDDGTADFLDGDLKLRTLQIEGRKGVS